MCEGAKMTGRMEVKEKHKKNELDGDEAAHKGSWRRLTHAARPRWQRAVTWLHTDYLGSSK